MMFLVPLTIIVFEILFAVFKEIGIKWIMLLNSEFIDTVFILLLFQKFDYFGINII